MERSLVTRNDITYCLNYPAEYGKIIEENFTIFYEAGINTQKNPMDTWQSQKSKPFLRIISSIVILCFVISNTAIAFPASPAGGPDNSSHLRTIEPREGGVAGELATKLQEAASTAGRTPQAPVDPTGPEDKIRGAMHEAQAEGGNDAQRLNALRRLLRIKGIDIETWADEQAQKMSTEDKTNLAAALKAIGLSEEQIPSVIDKIIICEVPQEIRLEKVKGINRSRIGAVIIESKSGLKILFPKDKIQDLTNKEYLADLVHEIVEVILQEQGVKEPEAHKQAMEARDKFLRGEQWELPEIKKSSPTFVLAATPVLVGAMHAQGVIETSRRARILDGNRKGGILQANFIDECWIEAGSYAYKLWAEGDIVYFQRYDQKRGQARGKIRQLKLNTEYQVGREENVGNNYLLPDDMLLSDRHFKIRVSRGGGNTYNLAVNDLGSLNGTTVEWREPKILATEAKVGNQDDIISENVDKIFSPQFKAVLWSESIGGNAGDNHAAVNGAIDASGRIVIFGNIQNFPVSIRGGIDSGTLYEFGIRVEVNFTLGGVNIVHYEYYLWNEKKVPATVKNILERTVQEANRRIAGEVEGQGAKKDKILGAMSESIPEEQTGTQSRVEELLPQPASATGTKVVIQAPEPSKRGLGALASRVSGIFRSFGQKYNKEDLEILKQLFAALEVIAKAKQESRTLQHWGAAPTEEDLVRKAFRDGIHAQNRALNQLSIIVATEAINLYVDVYYKSRSADGRYDRNIIFIDLNIGLLPYHSENDKGILREFFEVASKRPELLSNSAPLMRALMRSLLVPDDYAQPGRYVYAVLGLAKINGIAIWRNEEEEIGLLDRILSEAFREVMIPRESIPENAMLVVVFTVFLIWRDEPNRLLNLLLQFKIKKPAHLARWFLYEDERQRLAEQTLDEIIALVRVRVSTSLSVFIEAKRTPLTDIVGPDSLAMAMLPAPTRSVEQISPQVEQADNDINVIKLSNKATPEEIRNITERGMAVFIEDCIVRYGTFSNLELLQEYRGPVLFANGTVYDGQLCLANNIPVNKVINKLAAQHGISTIFTVVCNGDNGNLGKANIDIRYATGDVFLTPVIKPLLIFTTGTWVDATGVAEPSQSQRLLAATSATSEGAIPPAQSFLDALSNWQREDSGWAEVQAPTEEEKADKTYTINLPGDYSKEETAVILTTLGQRLGKVKVLLRGASVEDIAEYNRLTKALNLNVTVETSEAVTKEDELTQAIQAVKPGSQERYLFIARPGNPEEYKDKLQDLDTNLKVLLLKETQPGQPLNLAPLILKVYLGQDQINIFTPPLITPSAVWDELKSALEALRRA